MIPANGNVTKNPVPCSKHFQTTRNRSRTTEIPNAQPNSRDGSWGLIRMVQLAPISYRQAEPVLIGRHIDWFGTSEKVCL